ncbi:MAG TPA: hypothetical protein PLG35_06505, partial [Bacteroidales bacterium]|nr:hypothetical protein [Bacteroidales bacterium]
CFVFSYSMSPNTNKNHSITQFSAQSQHEYMAPDIIVEDLYIDVSLLDSGSMKTSDWDERDW